MLPARPCCSAGSACRCGYRWWRRPAARAAAAAVAAKAPAAASQLLRRRRRCLACWPSAWRCSRPTGKPVGGAAAGPGGRPLWLVTMVLLPGRWCRQRQGGEAGDRRCTCTHMHAARDFICVCLLAYLAASFAQHTLLQPRCQRKRWAVALLLTTGTAGWLRVWVASRGAGDALPLPTDASAVKSPGTDISQR